MVSKMKKLWKDQRGVTLIELLAVVVILGIIAAIAAPSIMTNFDKAKANSDSQTEKILLDAGKRYALDNKITTAITVSDFNSPDTNLDDYVDGYDADGYFVSQDDKDKIFQLQIDANGKATVTKIAKPTGSEGDDSSEPDGENL